MVSILIFSPRERRSPRKEMSPSWIVGSPPVMQTPSRKFFRLSRSPRMSRHSKESPPIPGNDQFRIVAERAAEGAALEKNQPPRPTRGNQENSWGYILLWEQSSMALPLLFRLHNTTPSGGEKSPPDKKRYYNITIQGRREKRSPGTRIPSGAGPSERARRGETQWGT